MPFKNIFASYQLISVIIEINIKQDLIYSAIMLINKCIKVITIIKMYPTPYVVLFSVLQKKNMFFLFYGVGNS